MPRTTSKPLPPAELPADLIDELHHALDRMGAVAELMAQIHPVQVPSVEGEGALSRAAGWIASEAYRSRQLLWAHTGIGPILVTTTY